MGRSGIETTAKENKAKKVFGYLRVSTGGQELLNQRHGILSLSNQHGWQVTFIEETVSGMTSYRDRRLGTIIEELQAGDILIVSEPLCANIAETLALCYINVAAGRQTG